MYTIYTCFPRFPITYILYHILLLVPLSYFYRTKYIFYFINLKFILLNREFSIMVNALNRQFRLCPFESGSSRYYCY